MLGISDDYVMYRQRLSQVSEKSLHRITTETTSEHVRSSYK